MGICDMHCHLLPEIDDGYLSREQFIRMLTLYQSLRHSNSIHTPPYLQSICDYKHRWAERDLPLGERGGGRSLGPADIPSSELFVGGEQETLKLFPSMGGLRWWSLDSLCRLPDCWNGYSNSSRCTIVLL